MINVYDDFAPQGVADKIYETIVNDRFWRVGWNTKLHDSLPNWNWHRSMGQDRLNMGNDVVDWTDVEPAIQELWDITDQKLLEVKGVRHKIDRIYANAHTYAQDGNMHTDDGSVTCLYYPLKNWNVLHEGGTAFYDDDVTDCIKYASYKHNRMVIFDAQIPHRAMPITRDCYELRSVLVFKTSIDVNDPTYAEWYYNR